MTPASPRINLLGRASVRRLARRRRVVQQAVVTLLVGAGLAAAGVAWHYDQLLQQREHNARDAAMLALWDKRAAEANSLKQSLQGLAKRQAGLQTLAQQQQAVGQGLLELASQMPPGVRLLQWQQEADTLVLMGTATSGDRLAALMQAWSASHWWWRPELVGLAALAPGNAVAPSAQAVDPQAGLSFSLRLTRATGAGP